MNNVATGTVYLLWDLDRFGSKSLIGVYASEEAAQQEMTKDPSRAGWKRLGHDLEIIDGWRVYRVEPWDVDS